MTEGIVMSRGSCNGNDFFVKSPFLSCKVLISEYIQSYMQSLFLKDLLHRPGCFLNALISKEMSNRMYQMNSYSLTKAFK